jgi:hypothetical protein
MKNILIFYTPIIEEIDHYSRIFQSIINNNKNNRIYIAKCDGKIHLKNCISNYRGERYKCYLCKLKRDKLLIENKNIIKLIYNKRTYKQEKRIANEESLKKLKYKGINIGIAVNSAIISVLRSHKYDFVKHIGLINKMIHTSKKTIDFLFDHYKLNFNEVYVFNGRVSHYNAVVEFCKLLKINYFTFEILPNREKYLMIKNSLPHNKDFFIDDLNLKWKEVNKIEREKIGKSFFFKNFDSKIKLVDYSSNQHNGLIPNEIIKLENKITIFGSSRNEYESIEGWNNKFLSGDDEKIILEICKYFDNFTFIYRVHPNLKLKQNAQTKSIIELFKIKNLFVIDQYSRVSSEELIDISEKVLVFGSSVGVLATFKRKPVISLGPSIYEKLDISYKPSNLEELKFLLTNKKLKPKSKEDAIKFGFYFLTRGILIDKNTKNFNLFFYQSLYVFISKIVNILKYYRTNQLIQYLMSLNDKRFRKKTVDYLFNKGH